MAGFFQVFFTRPGPQGDQGLQGVQGLPGVKGDTGNTGPAGPGFVARGVYANEVAYAIGDVVTHLGSSYAARVAIPNTNTTAPVEGASWQTMADPGAGAFRNGGDYSVLSTRALNTVYTNSSGRRRLVTVGFTLTGGTAAATVATLTTKAGGVTVTREWARVPAALGASTESLSFVVDPGGSYSIDSTPPSGGATAKTLWIEADL